MKFIFCFLLLSLTIFNLAAKGLKPVYLRCEYKENPVTDAAAPRLSWELTSAENGQLQTGYQILAASSESKLTESLADLWNSQKVNGRATSQVEYAGKPLLSRQICFWKVRSWDKNGTPGEWSSTAKWEMGLLDKKQWIADWIGLDLDNLGKGKTYHLPPAPYLRKTINIKPGFVKARLYVTALGLYEFSINGKKTGDDFLTPGWTDYDKRVYYQTYDVTSQIKAGANALASQLSYGWYAGYLGYSLLVGNPVVRTFYGKVPLLKAQLEVEYVGGKIETFATSGQWKASVGALLESDLLNGETYDARKEFSGWNIAGFKDQEWQNVQVYPDKADRQIQVYPGPPVKVTQTLAVKNTIARPEGSYIFDMGQNFAGIIRLKVKGSAGDTIRLRFGEKLHPDGRLMTENLRMARATDTYILKGDAKGEMWEPKFTYHGFQYVEIKGLKEKPSESTLTGLVIGSDTPKVGSFETDNKMINQLYSNIDWTQRANYVDIPTDCPQRDERVGWTGDAQVYVKSATFNRDVASFFTKWVVDLNDGQYENGAYPLYAPRPNLRKTDTFSPGWMEAGIICPYQVYRSYGDTRMISQGWPYMVAFMDFLEKRGKGNGVFKEKSFEDIDPKGGFGDWLSFGKKTPPDMLASFYYTYCADLMAEMAGAIGNVKDQEKFTSTAAKVRKAILEHYTDASGRFVCDSAAYGNGAGYVDGQLGFTGNTQTAYANAIYMNILSKPDQRKAGLYLTELLEKNGGKLATGFLGAKPLLPALSSTGHSDAAYKLFLSKEFPSWGFEVENGSTTIWERWDSFTKEDGFKYNAAMNSFSHYAFGAVCEWMFGNAAGIQASKPGFAEFDIRPEIAPDDLGDGGIKHLKASYHSINGTILSEWQKQADKLVLKISVPVNTVANVYVPGKMSDQLLVDGKKIGSSAFVKLKGEQAGYVILEVGSGSYSIENKR
ncbi:alpha-L-rhamnosidase [Dyadobacter psychrotolerans]|uniref:alpha-L-rhamnosidase n=1 Tax=Dyadobacter psychrotolerans TaxID=2541721 RepID=A0A4R5DA47_9BACT|nr:alpha-L-rhamnosidase [Dyadobacter psychrotolerans]TDE10502.1 alpha-L-rhamnosidase [Dyadobacter psychrotolerans]